MISDIEVGTLRIAVDFCYSGALPEGLKMADLALLLRAAKRFLMPHLMEACKLRLAGVIVEKDPSVFELYEAAVVIGDVDVQQMVRNRSRKR